MFRLVPFCKNKSYIFNYLNISNPELSAATKTWGPRAGGRMCHPLKINKGANNVANSYFETSKS